MPTVSSDLRYAVASAVAGGVVFAAFSWAAEGEIDWAGGAAFMLAFGLVVTVALVYSNREEEK
ncbi:hypothetical protein [Halopelagius longus]|uniref:Uncharacterized protein n=1 Tax=Halopelagius longus TaxID=1236180 RepID=A0A1H0XW56_9EURY|nr:hypothetical protein [Halopelagius longus]RDI72116.1 hypothetical protein DWB78_10545 [Halopelagius longus]SDQ06896.1 hypothetical protein SAMN05216278_0217 [Halopelagius longus]